MRILRSSDRQALARLVTRDESRSGATERQAGRIVADVRRRGDTALLEWTRTLDRGKSGGRIRSIQPIAKRDRKYLI